MKHVTSSVAVFALALALVVPSSYILAASPNLVGNPGFEAASGALPSGWHTGRWGTNTASFSYPVAGHGSPSAARVELTSRDSGDAKWYFDPIPVSPGETFSFSDWYRADVETVLTAQFKHEDGSYSYTDIAFVPPSDAWAEVHANLTVPAGAVSLTVFHLINRVGWLDVDDYRLTWTGSPGACTIRQGDGVLTFEFTQRLRADLGDPYEREVLAASIPAGTYDVTLVGEDRYAGRANVSPQLNETWLLEVRNGTELLATTGATTDLADSMEVATSTDTVARSLVLDGSADTLVARHAASIDASAPNSLTPVCAVFTPVDEEAEPWTGENLIENPGVDTLLSTSTPDSWKEGRWGTNVALFSLLSTGEEGNGLRVALTSHDSGDAKWYFPHVPVVPGSAYSFSDWYRADVSTHLTAEYELSDGSKRYIDLAFLPPAADWTRAETTFTAPADAVSVTVFHLVNTHGFLETDTFFLSEL